MISLAIDLLWIRPNKVGGIESCLRNLLDGMLTLDDNFEIWLLTSKDNSATFDKYLKDVRFHEHVCNIYSADVKKRILWQNLFLVKTVLDLGLSLCYEPYYCKPFLVSTKVQFITTIHDLQAEHYPEYFSKAKVIWMKESWKNDIRTSKYIVAISNYVKRDIIEHFSAPSDKIKVIYDAIDVDLMAVASKNTLLEKYGVSGNDYYFTVSSLLPHKNIRTLILMIEVIKNEKICIPNKLIVSGVGGKSKGELQLLINEKGLDKEIILTEYISNEERNALYKYCKAFLYPSIFEGFGMPPIEAFAFESPVITTREASIPETTQGRAIYVNNPFDVHEWIEKIISLKKNKIELDFELYSKTTIAKQYLELFETCLSFRTEY